MVDGDIQVLAESILSSAEIDQAAKLSPMFLLTEESRQRAKMHAYTLAPMCPKRPLFYAVAAGICRLPEEARNSMRYFGDYVDMLTKSWALLVTGDPRSSTRSLGSNVTAIGRFLHPGPDFLNLLESYDNSIYVPAKHDFDLPEDRTVHRFTAREALLTASISVHLAEVISIHHALQMTERVKGGRISVSATIVDPTARVLLIPVAAEKQPAYDVPHRILSANETSSDLTSRICEELTSNRGRIVRFLGLYKRPSESGPLIESAFVINSPYVPDQEVKAGTIWLASNDVHRSHMTDPAKDELDDFL